MAKGGNTVAVVILAIFAIGGFGLSGYMFIEDQFLGGNEYVPEHEHESTLKLVALWDDLDENFDTPPYTDANHFLIAYDTPVLVDTDYVIVHNETRFYLPVEGIYKINVNTLLYPVVATEVYWVVLMRNITYFENFERIGIEGTISTTMYYSKGSVYVNTTGGIDTYYEIQVYGTGTSGIMTTENYNQLSIEYVIQ
jgi:hypothetical protein